MNKKTGLLIILLIAITGMIAFTVLRKFIPAVHACSKWLGIEPTLLTIETSLLTAVQGNPGAVFTALSAAVGGIALTIRQIISMKNSTETLVTDLTNKGSALIDQAHGETAQVLAQFDDYKQQTAAQVTQFEGTIDLKNEQIQTLQDDRYKLQLELNKLQESFKQVSAERNEYILQVQQAQKQTYH